MPQAHSWRTRHASTGELRWPDLGDSDLVGGLVRPQSGRSVVLDDGTRLQLADDGLIQVDVATGAMTTPVTEEALGSYVSGSTSSVSTWCCRPRAGSSSIDRSSDLAGHCSVDPQVNDR